MSTHLSELCKGTEVEPIVECLRFLCPERAAFVARDDEIEEENSDNSTNGFSHEVHQRMCYTFGGIWNYQDSDGRSALHWAVAMRNFSLARTLMGDPHYAPAWSEDHDGVTPFATACMVGAPLDFLSELLFLAAEQRRWRLVQEQRAGCPIEGDVNELHRSVGLAEDVDETVKLCRMAILEKPDNYGNTPILHVSGRGNLPILRLLLQLGASIDKQNKRGQTVLHRSTSRGISDIVEELVDRSKKVHSSVEHRRWMNIQDYRGDTALFYASRDNNEELGRYLLRQGADRDVRNKDGKEFWEV